MSVESEITRINGAVTEQTALIQEISGILDGKVGGGGSTSTKVTIKEMYCHSIIKGVDEYEGQEKLPRTHWDFYMYINGVRFINSEYGEDAIRVDDTLSTLGTLKSINIEPFEIDPSKDFISFSPQTEAAFATYSIDGNKLIVQSYFW